MEEVKDLRDKADECFNNNDFTNAHRNYELLVEKLLSHISDTRVIRKLAKSGGWLAALLTGGFGVEDIVVVPAVNRILLRLFKVDMDNLLEILGYALRQKLVCLVLADGLAKNVDYIHQLNYFIITYRISTKTSEIRANRLKAIFELINPMSNGLRLENIEKIKSENRISDILLELIERQISEVERLNGYLFAFLHKVGRTNSPVFLRLKSKGYMI